MRRETAIVTGVSLVCIASIIFGSVLLLHKDFFVDFDPSFIECNVLTDLGAEENCKE